MVCKITHPKSIHRAIYYSEHKVGKQVAKCIHAANFLKDADMLTLREKKERFDQLIALNNRGERNTLHVSLNFSPGEVLPEEKLIEIGEEYMERLGFGGQPFIIYQHTDAAHPHVHIVSTNIQPGGDRIDMNYIGRNKSEPARKAIEEKYGLLRAEDQRKTSKKEIIPLEAQRVQYGKSQTKRSITNVLEKVLPQYKYRSLPELNAILRLYGIRADAGTPVSRISKHQGLVYQLIDETGKGVGVRIKASSIHFRPGLKYLREQFKRSGVPAPDQVQKLTATIDQAVNGNPTNWRGFVSALKNHGVELVPYFNEEGYCYGLTFINLDAKEAIKGSGLDKKYGISAILDRLQLDPFLHTLPNVKSRKPKPTVAKSMEGQLTQAGEVQKIVNILFRPEGLGDKTPYELSQKKEKRKPKTRHL